MPTWLPAGGVVQDSGQDHLVSEAALTEDLALRFVPHQVDCVTEVLPAAAAFHGHRCVASAAHATTAEIG
jgi:hypothetical protein